ncbi:S41 family peptidase [Janthinobacterium agaricidamnosum]|uniref:Tricorn protease homolog n=1 Tax=Janthinobacterium agaricidamnosum NBRC 102515 = DSM 9628 TaxID=1349767 RepID=W0V6V6_9BURK|nr:S41 family peptidase [Janthinobacterium agaricidamnosum]CDG84559.1 peptidase S41 family protein [Janthinobacterium agaricidamnosum NBRC 102515 = DSM 9628]
MKLSILAFSLLSAGLWSGWASQAHAADAYFRFPAIRGDSVVFTAEGDLWRTGAQGGAAQRLTTHPAAETNAAISRDGRWVAFSASYEGAQEVYVMPLAGGLPRRLSFENGSAIVLGWTAQGEVLFSTQGSGGPSGYRIVAAIDPASMIRRVFPVADANDAVLDDSGKTLYFTRFGLALTNDNVKHYRGGAHAQLWRYELDGKGEAELLRGNDKGNDKRPMWWQGQVYFISDRKGADNLWVMNPDGSGRRSLTAYKDWDVRNAALGDGKIVFQIGADLHVLDLATENDQALKISLVSDFDQQRARQIRSPLDNLTNVQLSGKDERIILTARGRVSIAGTGSARRVEIAVPEGARARDAVFSQDEKSVYAIVDTSGENEIWKFAADGSGHGEQLTRDGNNFRWKLYPSPDGRWLAHTDKRGRFWLFDLVARTNVIIDDAGKAGVDKHEEVLWSPDSKNLAVVRVASNEQREQIGLYNLQSKQLDFVTSDRYTSSSPVFSPDGRWLYFLSARNFKLANGSPWGDRNMGPVFDKRVGVFALALQPGNRFPFKPDDELSKPGIKPPETADEKVAEKAAEKVVEKAVAKAAAQPVDKTVPRLPAVVYAGLAQRLYEVPLASGNYSGLTMDDKRLYFLEQDGTEGKATLKTLAIAGNGPLPEVFAANVREYDLAQNKKHVYYRTFAAGAPGDMLVVDAGPKAPADVSKAKVKVDDWSFVSNPRLEWRQMFNDAWRFHRDFLYDVKMRGVNWNGVRDKYAPLVERVTDRAELNDVLGMMVSEVGALHSQIRPGELRRPAQEGTPAGLGAVLARTPEGYVVERIYRSEAELPLERSPLARADVDVREGDLITAVNGKSVLEARDIADLLLNQADKQVLLQVRRGKQAPRAMIVLPVNMARHNALRYSDWEQSRAAQVAQVSQGRIGYLHLRAMGASDIAAFARDFYANINRDGLIIDVRRNNGGNIDSWIIEKLLRKAWAFWSAPGLQPSSNMQNTFRGHLVVLVDELTYSDGETFAAGIKALGLGPLVGKRTAGAGVWLGDNTQLSDSGMARVAESGQFGADGQWLIEGVGVAPDVEVDNPPHATFNGADRQLEVALDMLTRKLKDQPVPQYRPQAIPALKY